MKKLATELLFGKNAMFSGLTALSIIVAIALGCSCGKNFDLSNVGTNSNSSSTSSNSTTDSPSTDAKGIPSDSVLQSMIKETTADFAEAVDSNNFHNIYEKSSSDFQTTYTEDEMKDAFKVFVAKKRFLVPSLKKVSDSKGAFSPAPWIRTENGLDILVLSGKFPTKPLGVKYEYEYVRRDGQWKLLKLVVNM